VIDELLSGASTEQDITGQGGLLGQLTKRMVERAMEVELTEHLGYETHVEPPGGAGNTRNGSTPKRLITEHGEVQINTPRDRDDSFEPRIVKKRQRRFEGFDDKILASEVTPRPSLLKQTESRRLVGQCTGRARLATWGGSVGPAAA
jgi:putative transposase